jgi:hypothetical protein
MRRLLTMGGRAIIMRAISKLPRPMIDLLTALAVIVIFGLGLRHALAPTPDHLRGDEMTDRIQETPP